MARANYEVLVEVAEVRSFIVPNDMARTPEQAEEIAEQWLEEGEDGVLVSREILGVTAEETAPEDDDQMELSFE